MSNWTNSTPGGAFPDLVYCVTFDKFYPCRVLATGSGGVLIEALVSGGVYPMRVPASIVYRRPAGEVHTLDESSGCKTPQG